MRTMAHAQPPKLSREEEVLAYSAMAVLVAAIGFVVAAIFAG